MTESRFDGFVHRRPLHAVRPRSVKWMCVAWLAFGACGSKGGGTESGSGGSGGVASSGGATSAGGASSSGGTTSTGGTTSSGGVVGSGGSVGSGGTAVAGHSGGGSSATGGASGGGTSGGGGTSPGGACTRDLLKSTVDAYFKALAAHSAAGLPLVDTVKATENGKTIMVGMDGLWKTAGTLKYAHSALDTDGCNTASEAVVPEATTDLPVALRLKLVGGKITEIETIAVRAGDYKVSGSNWVSKPQAIVDSNMSLPMKWEDPVPESMRNTAAELDAWMSKYFKAFPAGVCDTDANCVRLENGNSPGKCSLGASCQAGDPTGNVLKSHIIFSDVETGIGVGFDLFMGNADMHMFKMYGGKVYAVHAILGMASSTGWTDK